MAERNSKGQFVKGSGGGSKRKGKGSKGKGSKGSASGALGARVARLEAQHRGVVLAVNELGRRVSEHDRAIAQISSVLGERFGKGSKPRKRKG